MKTRFYPRRVFLYLILYISVLETKTSKVSQNKKSNFQRWWENSLAVSSIDKFMQVEEKLATGELTDAATLISGLAAPTNTPEENLLLFYQLYYNYLNLDVNEFYTSTDSLTLDGLSLLCPATDGQVVYQARALLLIRFIKQ